MRQLRRQSPHRIDTYAHPRKEHLGSGDSTDLVPIDIDGAAPPADTILARFTFRVPEGFGDLVVNPTDTTGRQLFATIRGRIWSTENAAGTPYAFDIWQTPEPASATLALLALAALGQCGAVRRFGRRSE